MHNTPRLQIRKPLYCCSNGRLQGNVAKQRHSREGGNPACMLMLLFPPRRKSTALGSRLRGNDGVVAGFKNGIWM